MGNPTGNGGVKVRTLQQKGNFLYQTALLVSSTPSPNTTNTQSEHVKQAQAFSHFIPHLRSCRFSSPVLSWTIAMLNLGVGPWTGEATRQEVETWVSCCKSIVSVSVVAVFLSRYVTLLFVFHPALASQFCVGLCCVRGFDIKGWLSPPPELFLMQFRIFPFQNVQILLPHPEIWWLAQLSFISAAVAGNPEGRNFPARIMGILLCPWLVEAQPENLDSKWPKYLVSETKTGIMIGRCWLMLLYSDNI